MNELSEDLTKQLQAIAAQIAHFEEELHRLKKAHRILSKALNVLTEENEPGH